MEIQIMNNTNDLNNKIRMLYEDYSIPPLLSEIILNRNDNIEFVKNIIRFNERCIIQPELLPHAEEVAERIAYHIIKGSAIFIYADYDCDGLNAGYIMHNVIHNLKIKTKSKAEVYVCYPERNNGFGISDSYVNSVIKYSEEHSNREILVLTVDNGISKASQINKLNSISNIEAIVTDHHPNDVATPDCLICDPNNMSDELNKNGIYSHLCGTGVVFKICQLLQRLYRCEDMGKYTANLAIATIADVMPYSEENMGLIIYGINLLNSDMCPNNFKRLKDALNIDTVNSIDIAWKISPILNSAGRMKNTSLSGEFIESENNDAKTIDSYIYDLKKTNDLRKSLTKSTAKCVLNDPEITKNRFIIYILPKNVSEGIAGVIAGNITEELNKPCMVLSQQGDDLLTGSIRCPKDIKLKPLLTKELLAGTIASFGGHEGACGVCVYRSELRQLQENLNKYVRIPTLRKKNKLYVDKYIDLSTINENTYKLVYQIPYNKDTFPEPTFGIRNCIVTEYSDTKNKNGKWIKVKQEFKSTEKRFWIDNTIANMYETMGKPQKIDIIVLLSRMSGWATIKYIEKSGGNNN